LSSPGAKRRRDRFVFSFVLIFIISPAFVIGTFAEQPSPKEKTAAHQVQPLPQPEKIDAAPKDARERTAVYVFLAWLWAAIFVLIYVLRLQIKESDRLNRLKLFRDEKK
jgi:hypothetical protein